MDVAGNFRDFNAAVTRMATLAVDGRITEPVVVDEISRLRGAQSSTTSYEIHELTVRALGADRAQRLDRFDRVQLEDVLAVCADARSLSEAGRELFAQSRAERTSVNDADRLKKYLSRFDLNFADLKKGT